MTDKTNPFGELVGVAKPIWLSLAAADLGIAEIVGSKNNPKVVAMFRDAGFSGVTNDETAWCAAFVGAKLRLSGLKSSGSLAALSYDAWGIKLPRPAIGAIGFKKRKNSRGVVIGGHVFFIAGWTATHVLALGGNQNNRVSIAEIPIKDVEGFRWPGGYSVPTVFPATMRNVIAQSTVAALATEA
jgi:uncharacterized protein (TIGR02594 family)